MQRNINLDMAVLECYHRDLSQVEWFLEKQAIKHQPVYFYLLKTIPGIGRILALTILYEIGDIQRFESVQNLLTTDSSNAKPSPPAKPMALKAIKLAMPTSNGPSLKRRFYTSEVIRALNNYCNAFKVSAHSKAFCFH
ncbi:hypothetical protein CWE07_11035 [Aliidiomarina maris]|uniref:Transposase IS116/IS110/IS902 C-terminal domain-containing protein n=1 Tax=Aliidiomarina maris TaxID=531312 RepID=A0ABY0BQ21_9GAMM|nr:hypothetical protein CWE07_11035 [Aliidiomarina maris]